MNIDIDKELRKYVSKKMLESEDKKVATDSDVLDIIGNINKNQRKIVVANMMTQEKIEKIQKENEELYKEKILQIEKENLQLNNKIRTLETEENKFVKKIINIMDEIYRLKYYADNCGNEKLMNTVARNLKSIKKELADIDINIISSVGEEFNEDYHDCIETKEDVLQENMKIVEEIKVGFIYKEKVIRPAEVVVIKNKGEI